MLWTLYRYVLKELLRNLLLATGVLVVIMSVATAIKPLSDGFLGPWALTRFIFFMSPAMLSLALPFTGAFAATLVFHRLTADGEITLCRASGISYRRLIMPGVMLGAATAACLFLLSCWMIPWFYERAEHTLQKDVVSMVIRKVQQGEPIRYDRLIMHADAAAEGDPPDIAGPRDIKPRSLVALTGIAIGRIDDNGRITSDGAAEHADMLLYTDSEASWIIIKLRNLQFFGEAQRGVTEDMTIGPYRVNSPFRQKLRFFSLPALLRLETEPQRHRNMQENIRTLARQVAAARVKNTLMDSINRNPTTLSLQSAEGGEVYAIRAGVARREGNGLLLTGKDGAAVEVDRLKRDGQVGRRFRAARAAVELQLVDDDDEPRITLRLHDVTVTDASSPSGGSAPHEVQVIKALKMPGRFVEQLAALQLHELKALARRQSGDTAVGEQLAIVNDTYNHLMRMTSAEMHERAALVVCTLVMMVGGAILGMMMAGRLALVVYLWMFVLAAVAVITTKTGGNLIASRADGYVAGLMVLWSGNAFAAAALTAAFYRLKRT